MKVKKYSSLLAILILLLSANFIMAQLVWEVPKEADENISFQMFNEDMTEEGRIMYDNSCLSCHGTPTQEDFTLMVPSPGDPATDQFQKQTDGALFYKIQIGRDLMPSFAKAYSEDEIWNLVSYIRSFNPDYKQPLPDLEGIVIPEMGITLDFDDNIDKLVVKASADGIYEEGIEVSAAIKTMFGKYSLGKLLTNQYGLAYFDVDSKIPGDSLGYLVTEVKVKKGYGFAKTTESMIMGTPTIKQSALKPRQLWSTDEDAPLWLDVIFHTTVVLFWSAMLVVLFNLRKLKNVK